METIDLRFQIKIRYDLQLTSKLMFYIAFSLVFYDFPKREKKMERDVHIAKHHNFSQLVSKWMPTVCYQYIH